MVRGLGIYTDSISRAMGVPHCLYFPVRKSDIVVNDCGYTAFAETNSFLFSALVLNTVVSILQNLYEGLDHWIFMVYCMYTKLKRRNRHG